MEHTMTIFEWAKIIGDQVYHKTLHSCKLVGVRSECESNNNVMLMVKTLGNEFYWVYDYETKIAF